MKTILDEILFSNYFSGCGCKQCRLSYLNSNASHNEFSVENELGITDGFDNRVMLHSDFLKNVPWRFLCYVRAKYRGSYILEGSGILISSRHVLTAAHIIYDKNLGREANEIIVIPALEGTVNNDSTLKENNLNSSCKDREFKYKFGYYHAKGEPKIKIPRLWKEKFDNRYDYGVIQLNEDLGFKRFNLLGNTPFGWFGSRGYAPNTSFGQYNQQNLLNKPIYLTGYLSLKEGEYYKPWISDGKISQVNIQKYTDGKPAPQLFGHSADATPGQSGGPIWSVEGGGKRSLIGIQSHSHRYEDNYIINTAVNLDNSVLNTIQGWIKAWNI